MKTFKQKLIDRRNWLRYREKKGDTSAARKIMFLDKAIFEMNKSPNVESAIEKFLNDHSDYLN